MVKITINYIAVGPKVYQAAETPRYTNTLCET